MNKRNPDCPALFQKAHDNYYKDGIWYENSAIGKNKLNTYMQKMSELGNLSKIYTNHCIRKTVVVRLDEAGFVAKEIMNVTGHKFAASFDPYLSEPTLQRKKDMSKCLQGPRQESVAGPSIKRALPASVAQVSCSVAQPALEGTSGVSLSQLPALPSMSGLSQSQVPALPCTTGGKRPKRDIPAALGVCPDSPVHDVDLCLGESAIVESIQHCSQSSIGEGGMTTNTAISVERRMNGALLSGASFTNCTVNINVYK